MSPYRTLTLASLLIPTALVAQQPVVPFGQALRAAIDDAEPPPGLSDQTLLLDEPDDELPPEEVIDAEGQWIA